MGSTGKAWSPGTIDKTNRLKNKNLIGTYYNTEDQSEYWKECQAFLDAIASRNAPLTDGVSGLRVLGVLQAAQRSLVMNGEPVALSLNVG